MWIWGSFLLFLSTQAALEQLDVSYCLHFAKELSLSKTQTGQVCGSPPPRSIVQPLPEALVYCDPFLDVGGSLSELFRVHKHYMFWEHKRGIAV